VVTARSFFMTKSLVGLSSRNVAKMAWFPALLASFQDSRYSRPQPVQVELPQRPCRSGPARAYGRCRAAHHGKAIGALPSNSPALFFKAEPDCRRRAALQTIG
jgi:hypothetical protein